MVISAGHLVKIDILSYRTVLDMEEQHSKKGLTMIRIPFQREIAHRERPGISLYTKQK